MCGSNIHSRKEKIEYLGDGRVKRETKHTRYKDQRPNFLHPHLVQFTKRKGTAARSLIVYC